MGAGKGGNFGNTKGSAEQLTTKQMLDALSDALAVASLIPGLDSITDLVSIPVDLARGDYLSAAFDLLGVIPVVGEAGDTAKIARTTNRVIDGGKAAKKGKGISSVADNTRRVAKKYKLNEYGLFGDKGKNVRVFKSSDPVKSSADFYKKISRGGTEMVLPNGKGVQTRFPDKSNVVYRVITKTPDSPAVNINIKGSDKVRTQKIHFIKE